MLNLQKVEYDMADVALQSLAEESPEEASVFSASHQQLFPKARCFICIDVRSHHQSIGLSFHCLNSVQLLHSCFQLLLSLGDLHFFPDEGLILSRSSLACCGSSHCQSRGCCRKWCSTRYTFSASRTRRSPGKSPR